MSVIEQIVNCICRPPRHMYTMDRLGSRDFDLSINHKHSTHKHQNIQYCHQPRCSARMTSADQYLLSPKNVKPNLQSQKQRCDKKGEKVNVVRYDGTVINKKGIKICYSLYINSAASIPQLYVMFLHSNNGSRIEGLPYAKHLLQAKYNVCVLDFSGSGLSEGENISLGPREVRDIEAVDLEMRKCYGLRRHILWGRSMGACTAIMYANQFPERVKCLILDSPYKDLRKLIAEIGADRTGIPKIFFQPILALVDGELRKKTNGYGFDQYKLKKYLINLQNIPAAFIVSWDDSLVKPHHGRKLYQRYPCSRKKLLETSGEHTSVRDASMIGKCIAFMNSALKENYRVHFPCQCNIFKAKQNQLLQTQQSFPMKVSEQDKKINQNSFPNKDKEKNNSFFRSPKGGIKRQNSTLSANAEKNNNQEILNEQIQAKNIQLLRNSDGGRINRISLKKKQSFNDLKDKNYEISLIPPANNKSLQLNALKSPQLTHISKNMPTQRLMENNCQNTQKLQIQQNVDFNWDRISKNVSEICSQFATQRFDERTYQDEDLGFFKKEDNRCVDTQVYHQNIINLTKSDELNLRSFQRTPKNQYQLTKMEYNFHILNQLKENPQLIAKKMHKNTKVFDFSGAQTHIAKQKVYLSKAYQIKDSKMQFQKNKNEKMIKKNFYTQPNCNKSYYKYANFKERADKDAKIIRQNKQKKIVKPEKKEQQIEQGKDKSFIFDERYKGQNQFINDIAQVDIKFGKQHTLAATAQKSRKNISIQGQNKIQAMSVRLEGRKQKGKEIKIIGIRHTNNFFFANEKVENKKIKFSKQR